MVSLMLMVPCGLKFFSAWFAHCVSDSWCSVSLHWPFSPWHQCLQWSGSLSSLWDLGTELSLVGHLTNPSWRGRWARAGLSQNHHPHLAFMSQGCELIYKRVVLGPSSRSISWSQRLTSFCTTNKWMNFIAYILLCILQGQGVAGEHLNNHFILFFFCKRNIL